MTENHTPEPASPAPTRRPRWRWVAGVGGLAVAAAIGVPTVAQAATTTPAAGTTASCTVADRAAAEATAAPLLRDYLAANPAVNTELTQLRALPKDQRRAEAKTYFTAHPDVKAALKQADAARTAFHKTCRT